MKPQNRSWTSSGVPRKNQMYSQLKPDTSGLGDRRITARITPRMIPMSIDTTVSSMVLTTPLRMRVSNRYWPTTCHSKCGLTTIERTIEAAMTSTITEAIHRPGRRTGTARISSGRSGRCSDTSVALT
jgi:hypothetical protein